LRIGFDGRAFSSPAAGVRRYAFELTRALIDEGSRCELIAVGLDRPELAPLGVTAVPSRFSLPSNLGWASVGLPLAARGTSFDVFHAPAYTAPLLGLRPCVVTVHDVSYARAPEDYPYKLDRIRSWFYRQSAVRATAIITDSKFSQSEITAAYGIPPERITVVPLGVGPPFRVREDGAPGAPLPTGIRRPFVLHVGALHRRRRPELQLEAVLRLRARHPALSALQLVLVGHDHGCGARLQRHAEAVGAAGAMYLAGVVPEDHLVELLQQASALVYASRYEGFGLPLLEAMACGTPIVAMRLGPVDEVVGDAGVLLGDAAGAPELADALEALLLSPARARSIREAGIRRAASFTWRQTASATLAVYERVVSALDRA
jgi:glycosyltransferase involved in cell wall biosynthesis